MDKQANITEEFLGSGWSFPVMFSEGNCQLKLIKYETNIHEMINFIMQINTRHNYEYLFYIKEGTNLQR